MSATTFLNPAPAPNLLVETGLYVEAISELEAHYTYTPGSHDPGDYWTPPYTEPAQIDIKKVLFRGIDITATLKPEEIEDLEELLIAYHPEAEPDYDC